MIKIILVLIAFILVLLGIYTYSNQTIQKSSPIPTIYKKEKKQVSIVAPKVKEKKNLEQIIDVKSPDTQVENSIEEKSYHDIENDSELSNQERDALIADKAYHEVLTNNSPAKTFSEEALVEMVNNDEFIKQRK